MEVARVAGYKKAAERRAFSRKRTEPETLFFKSPRLQRKGKSPGAPEAGVKQRQNNGGTGFWPDRN